MLYIFLYTCSLDLTSIYEPTTINTLNEINYKLMSFRDKPTPTISMLYIWSSQLEIRLA